MWASVSVPAGGSEVVACSACSCALFPCPELSKPLCLRNARPPVRTGTWRVESLWRIIREAVTSVGADSRRSSWLRWRRRLWFRPRLGVGYRAQPSHVPHLCLSLRRAWLVPPGLGKQDHRYKAELPTQGGGGVVRQRLRRGRLRDARAEGAGRCREGCLSAELVPQALGQKSKGVTSSLWGRSWRPCGCAS